MSGQSAVGRLEPAPGGGRQVKLERTIGAIVAHLIAERVQIDRSLVTPDAVLVDDLGASPLSIMVLALALEETFDIDVADDEVGQLCTVSDAVRCVRRALRRRGKEFKAMGWW